MLGDDISLLANTSIPVIRYRFQSNIKFLAKYYNSKPWQWAHQTSLVISNINTTTQFRVRVREDWGCNTSAWF